jgi:hypothetical protein
LGLNGRQLRVGYLTGQHETCWAGAGITGGLHTRFGSMGVDKADTLLSKVSRRDSFELRGSSSHPPLIGALGLRVAYLR